MTVQQCTTRLVASLPDNMGRVRALDSHTGAKGLAQLLPWTGIHRLWLLGIQPAKAFGSILSALNYTVFFQNITCRHLWYLVHSANYPSRLYKVLEINAIYVEKRKKNMLYMPIDKICYLNSYFHPRNTWTAKSQGGLRFFIMDLNQ